MCVGAFLGNRGGATQFRIDICVHLWNRINDLLWIIFVDDVGGLLFPESIGVNKFRVRRGEHQRQYRTWTERRAPQNGKSDGEEFWHEARVLSSISGQPANDFFEKK